MKFHEKEIRRFDKQKMYCTFISKVGTPDAENCLKQFWINQENPAVIVKITDKYNVSHWFCDKHKWNYDEIKKKYEILDVYPNDQLKLF